MNWSNSWSNGPTISKPYSEVLREQNQAAEKQMKEINNISFDNVELIIPINGGWDEKKIVVKQIGDLGVIVEGDEHLVIHVPTLAWFDKAIPEGEWIEEQLLRWCWKVQQKTDLWQAICSYDNSTYKTIPKEILNDLQNHCLSVPVE